MKPRSLHLALLLSVALNLGVIGAVVLDRLRPGASSAPKPALHQILALDEAQRARWEAAERPFLQQFDRASAQLEGHRTALIQALFADTLDPQRIESERAAIAELQQAQQRMIIDQLIAERAILGARQRGRLLGLLLDQPRTRSAVEDLHTR
ncbi:MAG: periplasmic heavy metal sensor [Proteobacteria bacterium]|nr:periplasmic heavy metal sensor [Pseudomonadota bacterium]